MAFFSKVGNILRQTSTKQMSLDLLRVNSSIFQAIRCMSSSKVFVGGVSYTTDDQSLKEAFARYGEVLEARVIMDRETGRSRGFAFVTYTSSEEASSAIQALDGQELHGRRVRVDYATERQRPNFGGDGYGGGGGGYGGGGFGGGAPAYGNSSGAGGGYGGGSTGYSAGGGYGGGSPGYSTGGGYGGGSPGYSTGGGYGGGSPGYSTGSGSGGGSGEPGTGNYNSTSNYAAPPIYNEVSPGFNGEGGYGNNTNESDFAAGSDQFANSAEGEFQTADDDEFGKAGDSRN